MWSCLGQCWGSEEEKNHFIFGIQKNEVNRLGSMYSSHTIYRMVFGWIWLKKETIEFDTGYQSQRIYFRQGFVSWLSVWWPGRKTKCLMIMLLFGDMVPQAQHTFVFKRSKNQLKYAMPTSNHCHTCHGRFRRKRFWFKLLPINNFESPPKSIRYNLNATDFAVSKIDLYAGQMIHRIHKVFGISKNKNIV